MKTRTPLQSDTWSNPPLVARKMFAGLSLLCSLVFTLPTARGSQAYGSVNNFDVVNDTSNVCHGFEIELDDINSTDITYTFDYNHYGVPKITEQSSWDATLSVWHTNVFVDYEGVWTNGGWSAYTAIPSGPIAPTMGHQFTNPGTNFGGEHFGCGYTRNPIKVLYFWLADNGSHTLTRSGQVYVSTPAFTYNPPVFVAQQQVQPAAAQAVIPAPILPMSYICPNPEFSDAVWCKVITTESHTNTPISINDLMTPNPDDPNRKDWRHGETNTYSETEWQLLQIDYLSSDYNPTNGLGGNNSKLAGANHNLTNSDDVLTYRYEYYAYTGPYADWDTHEALAQSVAANGTNGVGSYVDGNGVTNDLSQAVVVGKFLGAQMSGMAGAPPVGLVDHVPDGQDGVAYTPRTVIIAGDTNFSVSYTGALPVGMAFDTNKAVLFGTPHSNGVFIITVTAASTNNPPVTKTYPFLISAGAGVPPHCAVDTAIAPLGAGSTTGDNVYTNGDVATVTAKPNTGYSFLDWTENGAVVSSSPSYAFTDIINRSLVANFGPALSIQANAPSGVTLGWLTNFPSWTLRQNSDLGLTNWATIPTNATTIVGAHYQVNLPATSSVMFFRLAP